MSFKKIQAAPKIMLFLIYSRQIKLNERIQIRLEDSKIMQAERAANMRWSRQGKRREDRRKHQQCWAVTNKQFYSITSVTGTF